MTTPTDALLGLEQRLGRLFVIGLSLSAMALAGGLIAYLLAPEARVALLLLNGGLADSDATPLLRVMVSIVEYARMRDWFFVLTTIAVLVELTVTMLYALTRG